VNSTSKIAITFIIFISLLGIGAFYTSALHAEIGVEPENMEIVVAQGSETRGVYNIVNHADTPAHVKVDVEDWFKTRLGIKGIPVEQWIKVEPMEFDMEPKSTKQAEYVITPPSDQEGELAAMVYFGTTSPEGSFSITSRFGVSIYAAIENTIKLECSIKDLSVARNVRDPKTETSLLDKGLIFGVMVENSGNVHIRPTGNIEIVGENGDKYELKVERGFPVYQGKSLGYSVIWDKKDIAPGKYEVSVTLDCGKIYKMDKKIEKKAVLVVRKNGTVSFQ
jgi:hypothetical protein